MYTAVKFVDLRNEEEIMYSTSVVILKKNFLVFLKAHENFGPEKIRHFYP